MSVISTSEVTSLLSPVNAFLHCETPQSWIDEAQKEENLRVILTDHLICELKAAQSAMYLLRRYVADEETSKVLLGWLKPYTATKAIGNRLILSTFPKMYLTLKG